jgi:ABC-2 type transport system ATP-binding protein
MAEPVLVLDHVEKHFVVRRRSGRLRHERVVVKAVDGISLEVERGAFVGYLGPNGAGKSTTVKLCTGILVPSAGSVRVAGLDPTRQRIEVARRIGVVFGQRTTLWWDLPLEDSLALLAKVYRLAPQRHRQRVAELVELLDLGRLLPVPVRQLSLGQRMRGELAAALVHEPEILHLDEPTIGLDVVSKQRVREFLARENAERGTTVVLTTHDLADVQRLCRRVVVIDHGRVVHDGTVEELVRRFGDERTLVVDLVEPAPPINVEGARVVRVDGPRQWLRFRSDEVTAAQLVAAVAATVTLRDLAVEEPDIEEVVRRLYGTTG